MTSVKHEFTPVILAILKAHFGKKSETVLEKSELLQYLNIKTKAASRGSKSRAGFANHYAIYVLVEDYIKGNFHKSGKYDDYEGAKFVNLFKRQRELPFGSKLQNHALNHRLNEEFKKYFPTSPHLPIIHDVENNRYWVNENLLRIKAGTKELNIAAATKKIIEHYIKARQRAFAQFMQYCEQMIKIQRKEPKKAAEFIRGLLQPNIDARVFEIVSYAILKEYYANQTIFWGWSPDELNSESLILYKTGRTNANDGGIDFVMRPLGRFFQVTESIDAGKYFLDIDKVQRYPITFVVKTEQSIDDIAERIKTQAIARYRVKAVVERYMRSVEEIINIQKLMDIFEEVLKSRRGKAVIAEIVLQSKIEFNVEDG